MERAAWRRAICRRDGPALRTWRGRRSPRIRACAPGSALGNLQRCRRPGPVSARDDKSAPARALPGALPTEHLHTPSSYISASAALTAHAYIVYLRCGSSICSDVRVACTVRRDTNHAAARRDCGPPMSLFFVQRANRSPAQPSMVCMESMYLSDSACLLGCCWTVLLIAPLRSACVWPWGCVRRQHPVYLSGDPAARFSLSLSLSLSLLLEKCLLSGSRHPARP